ncbi:MFS transporter [Rhodobacteraceae bacterium]|nr:MFS transporter [Paracoccaceae bacterium]
MSAIGFIRDNLRFLAAGAILMFASSFGQTFFISTFAAEIMSVFKLTDGQWGLTYTIATTGSAVAMFWAGALTDRFRVRLLAWVVLPGLAISCFYMAFNLWVPGLVLCIFMLRFFGQGMTYQLAAVAMARWFVARRGLALSLSSMGIAFGTAVLPVVCALLLDWVRWQTIWIGAGVLMLFIFPVILFLLSRERTPQSHADESEAVGMDDRHWTRTEVLKSPLFWMLIPALLGPPAWGTSLFFQQVHIAEVKGWPLVSYLSLIPVLTVVSVFVTLGSGLLVDRFGTGRLLQIYLVPWIFGFVVLSAAPSLAWATLAFVVFGISIGLQSTIITAFWAEYFGTRHIGAIKAASTSVMVLGSAIGPGITGALIDFGYDFPEQMLAISGYFLVALVLVWFAIERANLALPVTRQIDVEGP